MHERISDEEAVNRVRGGDSDSYAILVDRHQARLQRLARRFLRNDADAEDAVQNAHLLALQHLDQFAGRASFVSWMSSITVNEALTQMRRRKNCLVSCEDFVEILRSPDRTPEQNAVTSEVGEVIQKALKKLPETYRMVFYLREVRDLSTSETGARLGLSAACVKTRLLRARSMMRKSLSERAENN